MSAKPSVNFSVRWPVDVLASIEKMVVVQKKDNRNQAIFQAVLHTYGDWLSADLGDKGQRYAELTKGWCKEDPVKDDKDQAKNEKP